MPYDNLENVSAEYQERAQSLGGTNAWIFKTKRIPDNEYMARIDSIIGKMPIEEKNKLAVKFGNIIPKGAKEWGEYYDDRIRDVLPEILGWGCLSYKFSDYKVEFSETPDLLAIDEFGEPVAGMECKKIWESEEEREWWRKHDQKSGTITTGSEPNDSQDIPLLKKLRDTLQKAEVQVNQSVAEAYKFIFSCCEFRSRSVAPRRTN